MCRVAGTPLPSHGCCDQPYSSVEYHETFWVTITAAAPVLALTYIVSIGGANRFDHAVNDVGIWGDTRANTILVLAMLGFVACTIDFAWGIMSLIRGKDYGPLIVPGLLIILSLVMILVLAVLEMRAYTWLKAARVAFSVSPQIAALPASLTDLAATDGGGHLYWPVSVAEDVVEALVGAGFRITGLDIRVDESDGSWTKSPFRRYGFASIEASRDAALLDLRTITSPGAFVEIRWRSE